MQGRTQVEQLAGHLSVPAGELVVGAEADDSFSFSVHTRSAWKNSLSHKLLRAKSTLVSAAAGVSAATRAGLCAAVSPNMDLEPSWALPARLLACLAGERYH
jgi:hypothetical protein